MQVDVRKQRRDHAALRSAAVRVRKAPVLLHARLQPLVDGTSNHTVTYPLVEDSSQVPVLDAVEKFPDVEVDHPATFHAHQAFPERLDRLVSRPTGPKTIRAVQEVLLVDGVQHNHDRALKHLVFKRRNPDRAGRPVSLRDLDATNRRRSIRTRLETVKQRLEVGFQVDCIVRRRLVVDTHRSILARALVGDAEQLHVNVMGQRTDGHLRGRPRQLCYSLKFR